MKKFFLAVALLLAFPAFGVAGMTWNIVPSSQTSNVNGIEFGVNEDFVVTNTLLSKVGDELTPYYFDFRVVFDHTDASGNYFFQPNNEAFQVYVLDTTLPTPSQLFEVRTLMVGGSEAINLGGGQYDYQANVIGGNIDLVFDTNLPLGHQVTSGSFNYDSGSVPEPSSLALTAMGILGLAVYRRIRV